MYSSIEAFNFSRHKNLKESVSFKTLTWWNSFDTYYIIVTFSESQDNTYKIVQ